MLARVSGNLQFPSLSNRTAHIRRREFVAALAALGLSGCKLSPIRQGPAPPAGNKGRPSGGGSETLLKNFTPEGFGAVGDGVTNDTEAFARMSAALNQSGGGTIILRKTTYLVGAQSPDSATPRLYSFAPAPIMNFEKCHTQITILGNGARLRCADGLRYGTFDPVTGAPTQHPMPYTQYGEWATPYVGMIVVENCTGKVEIRDLELDGNSQGLIIGGTYGDTGYQLPATGLFLMNNTGGQLISNVYTHHHGQDGLYISGPPDRGLPTRIENLVSEYNARQGCSIGGGANYSFVNSKFNHTGRAGLFSEPGAGLDIEAELQPIRNLSFKGCEFSNNRGVGMLADSGDTEGATFDDCRFIGTTTFAAWPRKPRFRFANCTFVGSIISTYSDAQNPDAAVQFRSCKFVDDPTLSPTGELRTVGHGYIADLGGGDNNVLFSDCDFDVRHSAVLPYTAFCIYNNCTMFQGSDGACYPRGTFSGTNKLDGNVSLFSIAFSTITGTLTLNGQVVPPTTRCC